MLACLVDNASNITRIVQLLIEENDDTQQGEVKGEEVKKIKNFITIDHSIHQMRGAEYGNLGFEMY